MRGPSALRLSVGGPAAAGHRTWSRPIVVSGVAAALDGLEPPPGTEAWVERGPFDDVALPTPGAWAPGAKALLAAHRFLLAQPGLGELPPPEARAIVVGTSAAALNESIHFMEQIEAMGATLVNPGLFPLTVMNAAAGLAAIRHRCRGPNVTLHNGPTSALDALAYAADLVAAERAELVFAGGFESIGEQARHLLGGSEPPATVSVLVAVTSAASARERGAEPLARLLAIASAGSGGGDGEAAERAREEALEGASHADAAALVDTESLSWAPAGRPETTLLRLLEGLRRSALAGGGIVPLVSLAGDACRAVALTVGPWRPSDSALGAPQGQDRNT